jgi:hypothetical protein
MNSLIRGLVFAAAVTALSTAVNLPIRAASPQDSQAGKPPTMDHPMPGHDQMSDMMQRHGQPIAGTHSRQTTVAEPTLPGQDAFGAIQEIVRLIDADPKTDWSNVNLEALRQHLIDMNDVILKADTAVESIDGGIAIAVTGIGRTVEAIQRIVSAHAQEIERTHPNGWSAKSDPLPTGVLFTVTANRAGEVQHVRGLGFIGIMVSGHHHQPHHLAMARGEMMR